MVDDGDFSARLTDPVDFAHHPYGVRHDTNDVKRGHVVKRIVWKVEVHGVHRQQMKMAPLVLVRPLLSTL